MATKRPQGDLVGWRRNTKHFRLGKTLEISSLDTIKTTLLMPAVGFEPTTSQSLSGDSHRLNHSATENWFSGLRLVISSFTSSSLLSVMLLMHLIATNSTNCISPLLI